MKFPKNLLLLLAANVARAGDAAPDTATAAEAQAQAERESLMGFEKFKARDLRHYWTSLLAELNDKTEEGKARIQEIVNAIQGVSSNPTNAQELINFLEQEQKEGRPTEDELEDVRFKLTALYRAREEVKGLMADLDVIWFDDILKRSSRENTDDLKKEMDDLKKEIYKEKAKPGGLYSLQTKLLKRLLCKFCHRNAIEADEDCLVPYVRRGGELPGINGKNLIKVQEVKKMLNIWKANQQQRKLDELYKQYLQKSVPTKQKISITMDQLLVKAEDLSSDEKKHLRETLREIDRETYKTVVFDIVLVIVRNQRIASGNNLTPEQKQGLIDVLEEEYGIPQEEWSGGTGGVLKEWLTPPSIMQTMQKRRLLLSSKAALNGFDEPIRQKYANNPEALEADRQSLKDYPEALNEFNALVNNGPWAPATPSTVPTSTAAPTSYVKGTPPSTYKTVGHKKGMGYEDLLGFLPVVGVLAFFGYLWYHCPDLKKTARSEQIQKAEEASKALEDELLKQQEELKKKMKAFDSKMQIEIKRLNAKLKSGEFDEKALKIFKLKMDKYVKELETKKPKDGEKKKDSANSNKEVPQNQMQMMSNTGRRYLLEFKSRADKNVENLSSKLKSGKVDKEALKEFESQMKQDIKKLIEGETQSLNEYINIIQTKDPKKLREKFQAMKDELLKDMKSSSDNDLSEEDKRTSAMQLLISQVSQANKPSFAGK